MQQFASLISSPPRSLRNYRHNRQMGHLPRGGGSKPKSESNLRIAMRVGEGRG